MKKSAFIIALLFASFLGFGQNEMPYYIMYQMQGDTVYRNLQSVDSIHIDSTGQQFVLHNGTDWVSLSDSDTVYIFRDKFRRYVGEIGDWDDVVFSMEQICFYKESNVPGVPRALLNLYVNDSIPDGYFVFTKFDEEGNPDFVNFNDTCFMKVNRYYGEYYDATVMSSDMSIMTMDSIRMEESLDRIQERFDALGRAGYAISPLGRAFARQRCVLGGASMVMGTAGMMIGCAMLIPGVNIAMGMTIAIAGAAAFVSGALAVTRATDQLLSDGTHTQGFAEASSLLGLVSNSPHGLLINLLLTGGYDGFEQTMLQAEANWPYERAQQIRSMELSATGRATLLDMESHSVRLFGQVSQKLDPNDRFGIMISRDQEALTVEDCQLLEASHPIGAFSCDFSGLEPCGGYYYRSYYYSTELASFGSQFSPWVVSTKKSFKMPGVKTLGHEQSGFSFSYDLYGEFQDVANQPSHTVGFCYSYTNTTPTFDDHITQKTVSNNGEFSDHVFLDSDFTRCYYRAYAFINGEIAYGEVRQIGVEVTTYMAENVTATTATCWGEVVCEECEVTERGICWSTSHNPTTSGSHINEGQGTGFYSCSLTGLTPGTTYYARAYAIVGSRTLYGNEVSFTTLTIPTVTTAQVTNITQTTATGGGTVTDEGSSPVTMRGLCWSTSHNPTTSSSHATSGTGTGSFTVSMTGLTQGTTYYVRAYATNEAGTAYGNEVSFTTLTIPTVTTAQVTNITQTTATGGGTVTDEGSSPVTMRGLCWSTGHNPTTSSSHATSGAGTGSFAVSMTGLTQGTTYYVRAYATNEAGTAYGNEVTFTTQDEEPCDCNLTSGDWVDLGLPSGLLWATRNVGASSPEDRGDSFAWGETSTKSGPCWWETYIYSCGGSANLTKYCQISYYGCMHYTDNLTILQPSDDAATANYGGRTPTKEEWQELDDNCTKVSIMVNGIWGCCVTGPNGNSLFLPCIDPVSMDVIYWSSSLRTDRPSHAYRARVVLNDFNVLYTNERSNCLSVRAVREN